MGRKGPRGSREREPANAQCEPKDNDEVAHEPLPSNFAMSSEASFAQPGVRASESLDYGNSPKRDRPGARAKQDLRDFWSGELLELGASLLCLRAPRHTPEARDKAGGLTPKGSSEMGSSSEVAVRCNKKSCLPCVIGK